MARRLPTPAEAKDAPTEAAQAAALKQVRDVFKALYANAKKPADKLSLAQKPQKLANESQDDRAIRFVCLEESQRLVAESGDLAQAFESIDAMAEEFQVNAILLRAATLRGAAPKFKEPALNREVVERSIPLIEQLQASDQYQEAVNLATAASQAVLKVKDKALTASVQSVRRDADDLAKEFVIADKARHTLTTKPNDAAAKLAWGKWLCLRKDEWDDGLKLLEDAEDPKLKQLATRDRAASSNKEAIAQLGADWLEYAKAGKDRTQTRFAARALHWFYRALEEATGIAKTRLEGQIEQAEKLLNRSSIITALAELVSKKVLAKEHTKYPEASSEPTAFRELPSEGAILVGMRCRVGKYGQYTVITAIQMVYATKRGLKPGEWHGKADGDVVDIVARDGYAVSNLGLGVGTCVDSVQIRFSRVTRSGLDLADSYESKRIGGPREIDRYVRGPTPDSQPIIGIFGSADDYWRSLECVTTR